jgi:hypothetical protein
VLNINGVVFSNPKGLHTRTFILCLKHLSTTEFGGCDYLINLLKLKRQIDKVILCPIGKLREMSGSAILLIIQIKDWGKSPLVSLSLPGESRTFMKTL